MWQKLLELARLIWTFGEETRQNTEAIKQLQEESRQTLLAMQRVFFELERVRDEMEQLKKELQHAKDNERHEREKLILQLQNDMLRFERRLLPPTNSQES